MTFEEHLKQNPLVNTSRAIPILTHLTLTQYGVLSSENLNKAYIRISDYISDLVIKSSSVTKHFYIVDPTDQYADDVEVNYDYYCDTPEKDRYILVNFCELLTEYNKCRVDDGFGPIQLSARTLTTCDNSADISDSALADFAVAISQIATNCVAREDLMKADVLKSIIAEGLSNISDETIKAAIPKIKAELRNSFSNMITKGRLNTVTDKKIKAAIHLTDTIKGPISVNKKIDYQKEISNFDLSVADRDKVVEVFVAYKSDS